VGVYGIVWGFSLTLFHVGLIRYYPLETETWIVIVSGWMAFLLGSATVVGARYACWSDVKKNCGGTPEISESEHSLLLKILWTANIIVVAYAAHQVYIVTKLVGNVTNFLALGNLFYSLRVHEGLPGTIPYLGSLSLTVCLLAGLYTSLVGRLKLVAIVPLLAMIVISITNMTRAFSVIGAILFLTGYFSNTRKIAQVSIITVAGRLKRAVLAALLVALFVSAMEVVRGNRGMTERFAGATTALSRLGRGAGSFLTPSIVMYLSVQHGVLNQYLKEGIEDPPIGNYSFAPVWRALSKIGFNTYVAQHQPFYRVPMSANTGSYLRELHADYGIAGVVVGPFLLGLVATMFWLRYESTGSLLDLVVLGHVFVAVGISLFAFATQLGNWQASLIFGIVISFIYSRGLPARALRKSCPVEYD
jgi:oligosaccharide repeat unit polymerase